MPTRRKNRNPGTWTDSDFRIFISHLSTNKAEAQELKKHLATFAIKGFVAHSDIKPSKEWQNEIELALKTCDAFTALLVQKFHKSNWTDQEVGFVLARDIPIYPASMDGTVPYGFLAKVQAHFVHGDIETFARNIYLSLITNKKTQKKLAHAVLNYLEDSPSFDDANKRSVLLTNVDFWDENLIQKLEQIYEQESQVNGANKTSGRIQRILRQFKLKNGRSLVEAFKGVWLNNYRHHSGRHNSEQVEIKDGDKYYADGKLTFRIDQEVISKDLKNVRFRKTHVRDGGQSITDLELVEPNVYKGTEKGNDGTSKVQYKKLKD
jgi:hypothetical protein